MMFKNLSIIGGGPNCVYALEILLKKILKEKNQKKRIISIFEESGLFGCGKTHSKFLDKNILLNRVAGQISLGSYPFNKFQKNLRKYDYNFMEWKKKEFKKIKSTDWPPRYIFGLALEQKILDLLKIYKKYTKTEIIIYFKKIISIKKKFGLLELTDIDKKIYLSDKILILTGNYISSNNNTKLNKKILSIKKNTNCKFEHNFLKYLDETKYWVKFKNKKILIYGTGVSSLDLITKLESQCKKIIPISRTFLFPFARPFNQKLRNPKKFEHKGIILTYNLIKKLREKINKQNNFKKITIENTILPIIKAEFYLIYFKKFLNSRSYKFLEHKIKSAYSIKNLNKKLNFLIEDRTIELCIKNLLNSKSFNKQFYKKNWFSKKNILESIKKEKFKFFDFFSNPLILEKKNFIKNYLTFLKWDIDQAKMGNLHSPFKKACDGVWRDLRPLFTYLLDNTKNQKLYNEFINKILPTHNRLADGPSLYSIKKIKKMIKSKKIDLSYKDKYFFEKKNKLLFIKKSKFEEKIDFIFSAVANIYKNNFIGDVLILNMRKNNIIDFNKIYNSKLILGVKLNKFQHPINKKNIVNNNITFVGPASEGSKFFHHTLSRPDKKQFNTRDLELWVSRI